MGRKQYFCACGAALLLSLATTVVAQTAQVRLCQSPLRIYGPVTEFSLDATAKSLHPMGALIYSWGFNLEQLCRVDAVHLRVSPQAIRPASANGPLGRTPISASPIICFTDSQSQWMT